MDRILGGDPEWTAQRTMPRMNRRGNRQVPVWWHPGGNSLSFHSGSEDHLCLSSEYARLILSGRQGGCVVQWLIKTPHCANKDGYLAGQIIFDIPTFIAAFGGLDLVHFTAYPMIHLHGGVAARQGFFLRFDEYLNIPGPGCGMDGDPNISIYLEHEIKDEIARLTLKSS